MDQTIIFCRTLNQCSSVYMFMADRLGKEMMWPIGTCRDLQEYHHVLTRQEQHSSVPA